MAKQLFKGFKQVIFESGMTFENDFVYFVREDETKEHGFIYFNGKKYGTTKEVADKLATLECIDVEERLKNLEDVSAETRITNIENDYLKGEDKTALENSIAEVRTIANEADTLPKENKSRLDSIGQSVVDGKLCVTFNQDITTKPILLDETGKRIVEKFKSIERVIRGKEYNSKQWILTFDISGPISNIAMSGDIQSWLNYRSKLGRYLVSTDGKARKLNKDNSDLLEDGTSYDITSGHIMTRFPNLYFTCVTNSNIVNITLSEKPFANCKAFGEQWIGSYLGQVLTDGKLVSRSGLNPTSNMTINSFLEAAQKNGSNWGLSDYRQRQMMMVIYLCEFLDANSQKCLGYGMNGNANNWVPVVRNAITGKTNILGDRCGKVNFLEPEQNTSAACHVSLFGIEDPYGWYWEFIQGVYFGSSANTKQDGTECFIYEGNRMPTSDELITQPTGLFRKITRLTSEGWIKNLIWGENMDILPAVLGGGSATGHGDYHLAENTGQVLLWGGNASYGANCGIAYSDSHSAWSGTGVGARLAYYGVVDIV